MHKSFEVEKFSNHFLGLKFYWKGVANCKNRYSHIGATDTLYRNRS